MESPLILLVDDEVDFLNAVQLGLQMRGFKVHVAGGGSEALKFMEDSTPDVVITDLRMQPMNGFDLYQHVKKIPRLSNTHFFFLTGVTDRLAEKYGLTLGAEAYLVKPVDLEQLVKSINRALEKTP